MKLAVALGGFAGFLLVSGAGFIVRRDPATVFLEASIACVFGAMLFRWLHLSFVRNVRTAVAARRQQAQSTGGDPSVAGKIPASKP